jgi:uncharacterized MAPEG superfamily protein
MARLTPTTLNVAVGIYLVSRALYNLIYISNTTRTSTLPYLFCAARGG